MSFFLSSERAGKVVLAEGRKRNDNNWLLDDKKFLSGLLYLTLKTAYKLSQVCLMSGKACNVVSKWFGV
jgi:hypothetical protein